MTESVQITSFALEDHQGGEWNQDRLKTKKIVLYFYPKDDTPGCTSEAKDFARLQGEFAQAGWEIVGVSKDTIAKHIKFSEKYELPFALIADVEGVLCDQFGVFKKKSMFGKSYMGIERSTFLLDQGQIVQAWRKVKVSGHVEAVLKAAQAHT